MCEKGQRDRVPVRCTTSEAIAIPNVCLACNVWQRGAGERLTAHSRARGLECAAASSCAAASELLRELRKIRLRRGRVGILGRARAHRALRSAAQVMHWRNNTRSCARGSRARTALVAHELAISTRRLTCAAQDLHLAARMGPAEARPEHFQDLLMRQQIPARTSDRSAVIGVIGLGDVVGEDVFLASSPAAAGAGALAERHWSD